MRLHPQQLCYFAFFLITACQAQRESREEIKEATAELKSQVVGTWQGTLPCAGCEGIDYQLVLNPDGSYDEQLDYRGTSEANMTTSGKWLVSTDSIVHLDKDEKAVQLAFAFVNGQLQVTDLERRRIDSGLKAAYSLQKSGRQTDIWTQKARRGIDFVAMGNEPSWSLEIDFEKSMVFTSLNEPDTVVTPVPAGLRSGKIVASAYTAETENGLLSLTISEEACTDAMSGENFGYKVTVSAKSLDMPKAAVYSGCGRYLSDNPLHGAWALESVGGQNAATLFGESKPFLEFRVNEGKLAGMGGCNQLSGTVEVTDSSIVFAPIISTKMACPAMEAEQQFLKAITDQEIEYQVENEQLVLKTGTDQLIFSRMETLPER